jgi:HprK-related kinase A
VRIAEADVDWLANRLSAGGIGLDFGAARVRVESRAPGLARMIHVVYGAYAVDDPLGMFDVSVNVRPVRGLRAVIRRQVELICDGARDLEPFPLDTPLPLFEWGTNYALASRLYCYLLLHAGVVARDGRAVVMPAMPGSGKSTLTAALSLRGYRLLSDEFGVVRFDDARLLPMTRPVALKNESIDVIANAHPEAVIGPRFPKTHKGTVAHLAPLVAHVDARHVPATPTLVIFPKFHAAAGVELEPIPKARAFARLAVNSFNYDALGPDSFDTLSLLVQRSSCWTLRYGDLDAAIRAIGELLDECTSSEPDSPSNEPPAPATEPALVR